MFIQLKAGERCVSTTKKPVVALARLIKFRCRLGTTIKILKIFSQKRVVALARLKKIRCPCTTKKR